MQSILSLRRIEVAFYTRTWYHSRASRLTTAVSLMRTDLLDEVESWPFTNSPGQFS